MTIVFPRWVTKLGAWMFGAGAFVELLQVQVLQLFGAVGIAVPDVITWGAILAGGALGILGKALMDADGDGVPDGFQRRGGARPALLAMLVLLGACGVAAASSGKTKVPPTPTPNTVSAVLTVGQNSLTFTGGCRLHVHASTCRWSIQRNGVAVPNVPDGLTFSTTGAKPAPGDSVVYRVQMKWVNPEGVAAPGWSDWITRNYREGFPVPPTAPTDSIVSVVITATP